MIVLGEISLMLTVVLAFYALITSIIGFQKWQGQILTSSRRALVGIFILLTIAVIALSQALITRNYELKYVVEYTSNNLSVFYALSAIWAGQAGSLLVWAWLLSLFTAITLYQNRNKNLLLMPYVSATLSGILLFFIVLLVFVSSPFERMPFLVQEGQGLNPLLQNPGMMFHPTTQYLGYVAFSIPFAFAIGALLTRKLDSEWITSTRRWTLFAWFFLTLGIIIGAEWAYVELGWGGFWGWDPVENASFMPWLTGTAFLHSVMIQERRSMLKIWNVVLILLTFLLTILGTFITRSGIIASVHAFSESTLGYIFLLFMAITLVFSTYLVITRREELKSRNKLDSFLSRESSFLFNNLLLLAVAFATLWGTLFPMISEAVRGIKITVGPPFFNTVTLPIGIALILLTGICPLIAWRKASVNNFFRNFLIPSGVLVTVFLILLFSGIREIYPLLSFSLISFVISSILMEFYRGVKARMRYDHNVFRAFFNLLSKFRRRYGGYIVHIGVMLMFIGMTGISAFSMEKEGVLKKGESMTIKNYKLTNIGVDQYKTAVADVISASLRVEKDGKFLGIMNPSKEFHTLQEQLVTEVAIRSNYKEDLYLILGSVQNDGSIFLKVKVNPLITWLWWGTYVLVVGTLIAWWPGKRSSKTPVSRDSKTIAINAVQSPETIKENT